MPIRGSGWKRWRQAETRLTTSSGSSSRAARRSRSSTSRRTRSSSTSPVLLHCPNCDIYREGVFAQDTVEAFDEELDRGADALARDYKRLMRVNMAEEIDRFVGALQADAILTEDF